MAKFEFKVRRAKKRDLPDILKLVRQWCREDGERPAKGLSQAVIKSSFSKNGTSTLLVVEDHKGLVGYAYAYLTYEITANRPDLMLQDLYVTKKRRGAGAGDRLMAALARLAKQEEADAVYWMVNKNNTKAKKFYARQGAIGGDVAIRNLKGKALMDKAKHCKKI